MRKSLLLLILHYITNSILQRRPTAEMVRDDKEESGWRKVADPLAPALKEVATAEDDPAATLVGDDPAATLVGGDEVDMEDAGEAA
jgi:hypothetical protein